MNYVTGSGDRHEGCREDETCAVSYFALRCLAFCQQFSATIVRYFPLRIKPVGPDDGNARIHLLQVKASADLVLSPNGAVGPFLIK